MRSRHWTKVMNKFKPVELPVELKQEETPRYLLSRTEILEVITYDYARFDAEATLRSDCVPGQSKGLVNSH